MPKLTPEEALDKALESVSSPLNEIIRETIHQIDELGYYRPCHPYCVSDNDSFIKIYIPVLTIEIIFSPKHIVYIDYNQRKDPQRHAISYDDDWHKIIFNRLKQISTSRRMRYSKYVGFTRPIDDEEGTFELFSDTLG